MLRKLFFVVNVYEIVYNLQFTICRHRKFKCYWELSLRGPRVVIIFVFEAAEFVRLCKGSVLPERLRNPDLQGVVSYPITAW